MLTRRKQVELKWGIEGKEVAKRVNKMVAGDIFVE